GPAPRISEPSRPVSASIKPGPAVVPSGKRRLIRGERVDVATLGRGDLVLDLAVKLSVPGANLCALGLLENERFAGDEYFVFQDQPATPCGSCRLLPNGREADLHLELASAPARIHRFLIMVYTDAQRGVGTHGPGHFQIRQGPAVLAESSIHAEDLGTAPCAIIAEIYRRNNGWRLGLQLAGTGKSLEALLRSYGAEVQ
ncbi:MAG: TerD family protein, partial [Verrucomicrobiota bacterium]